MIQDVPEFDLRTLGVGSVEWGIDSGAGAGVEAKRRASMMLAALGLSPVGCIHIGRTPAPITGEESLISACQVPSEHGIGLWAMIFTMECLSKPFPFRACLG